MDIKNKRGFTVVELMTTIAILAILSGLTLLAFNPSIITDNFNDQRRLSDIQTISKSIEYLNTLTSGNLSLGSANVIYLSLPDNTSPTCASYSLASLPEGYSYSCKDITTYKLNDGRGWIPVNFKEVDNTNILKSIPVDPVNDSNYYYSYNPGGSYEVNAFFKTNKYIDNYASADGGDSLNALEIGFNLFDMPQSFPHNWIKVPGNSEYGTKDFLVMQFESKYSVDGKTGSDAPLACKETDKEYLLDIWYWGKNTSSCSLIVPNWYFKNVVSSPLGSPISGITQEKAKEICASMGAHLLTDPEWMTIARNVAVQPANWTSGKVGVGYLFNGNSGDTIRGYIKDNPYYSDPIYWDVDKGLTRDPRSIMILSNGSKIYDFSGNLWEHIDGDAISSLPEQTTTTTTQTPEGTNETTTSTAFSGSYDPIQPAEPSWNTGNGVGLGYTNTTSTDPEDILIRGGLWDDGGEEGSLALTTSWPSGAQGGGVGFRCAK